jgi:RNA polymerase sigma factor (sigma-70 family)
MESYASMVRLAYLMVGSKDAAEDIVGDCFARMADRARHVETPAAYLRVSVVNGCRSWLRRQRTARAYHPEPPDPAVETSLVELRDALLRLPARQRIAVVLRYYDDLSEADIACALDCRPGTVKSLLSRALTELRKEVEK